MKAAAVIVSAGRGHRFPGGKKKQFLSLAGKPILCYALDSFEGCPSIDLIHLVVGEEDMEYTLREIVEPYQYRKIAQVVPGGEQRQDSVKMGIDTLGPEIDLVAIHDGVRPFVTREMIEGSLQEARQFKACVVAVPVKETIKRVGPGRVVLKTLDRESLWQIQTPQTFQLPVFQKALRQAEADRFVGTDDASLVERIGVEVHILPGSYDNIKITTPEDLIWAHLILEKEQKGQKGRNGHGEASVPGEG